MYKILKATVISDFVPHNTDVLWLKPVNGGFALYYHLNGVWKILRLMNDHGTTDPGDDTPIDIHEGQLGPDTVGSEQIIDNSIMENDLNDSVRGKIQKTYHQDDESLHMNYDIASTDNYNSGGSGEFNDTVTIEEEGD